MAKLIKCPRCQSLIDVTNLAPGNTVKCPDCGGMARIPTGQTGIRPRVPTPAPQPAVQAAAAAPAREGTRMHQRRGHGSREGQRPAVRAKGGNTGVIIALVLAVAVVAAIAVMVLKGPGEAPVVKKKSSPMATPAPEPEPEPAPAPPAPAPEPRKPTEEELKIKATEDAKTADWDVIMGYMRTGGAYDDPDRPEGFYYNRIKAMGKAAYPYIMKYLDHEELTMARSAANLLNALTGQNKAIPNPTNRAQVKAEWDAWIKANP